ncbi:MAG: DUF6798 domain-containing protein [Planctomycetota bacterium]
MTLLVLLVAGGDPPAHRNEAHYLCRLKHYWDPGYCAGDLFLESPDAHFTVVWLFGWVTRVVSLEATAWLGRGVSWLLLAWAWQRLISRLAAPAWLAPLGMAAIVTLTEQTHFAGEWLVGGFEAKTLAYPLVIFALCDAMDGRWNRAWALLGGASALHALVGGWSVVALLVAWLGLRTRGAPPFWAMTPGLAVGAALSLAGVGPALALNVGTPGDVVAEANQAYVFTRLPHHLAPLTKPWGWIGERAGRHAVAIALLWLAGRWNRAQAPSPRRESLALLVRFAWGAELISFAGLAIETALWNQPERAAALLRYYWFRLGDIAAPLATVAVGVAVLSDSLGNRTRAGLAALAVAVSGCVAHHAAYVAERWQGPVAPADQLMTDPIAWQSMCEWVQANTPQDALFLLPRRSHTFKWRAERAEVVTYKDVPQNAEGLVEWRRRFHDVYRVGFWENGDPRWARSLAALGGSRLRELGAEYGAAFALDQAPRVQATNGRPPARASLPVVHQIGPYTLYWLGDPTAAPTFATPISPPSPTPPP